MKKLKMKKYNDFIKESIGDISAEEIENEKKYGTYDKPTNEDDDSDFARNVMNATDDGREEVTKEDLDTKLTRILNELDLEDVPFSGNGDGGSPDQKVSEDSIIDAVESIKSIFWEFVNKNK